MAVNMALGSGCIHIECYGERRVKPRMRRGDDDPAHGQVKGYMPAKTALRLGVESGCGLVEKPDRPIDQLQSRKGKLSLLTA